MKKLILGLALIIPLAACSNTEKGAVAGGAIGAGTGALVSNDPVAGALIGGAVGAVAGALIGKSTERPGYCEYRDRRGRRYVDRCPDGY